jgi:hypothetical protein
MMLWAVAAVVCVIGLTRVVGHFSEKAQQKPQVTNLLHLFR